ncbi:hypothetical protein P3T18_001185 [Paraburkholderia sp. GAS199]
MLWIDREVPRQSELRIRHTYPDLMRRVMKPGTGHSEDDADMDRLITSLISLRMLHKRLAGAHGANRG